MRTNRPALPPRGGISRNIVRLLEGGLECRGGVYKIVVLGIADLAVASLPTLRYVRVSICCRGN